ncbi:MAG: RsmB/NOP family class I SAM-dependent RNA methyltransferase [Lachnospiraceae bacterium]|nr:RsmB/NOP family class I SAM-dependent RNA methyltransferase [Lachnospiraceae bacterium]
MEVRDEKSGLPEAFCQRMQEYLGQEYQAFLDSYRRPSYAGLRINTLKVSQGSAGTALLDDLIKTYDLTPVEWCRQGYYYDPSVKRPGRHPLHEAGAYYIQEPSAMSAAAMLKARPGERILDLCAAPGGKSTQIAADMQGQGLLIVNEIHPGRAKILSQNIERMGICNAVVLNEAPDRLAEVFCQDEGREGFFDAILCDAPCSGEGMFRKDQTAVDEWTPQSPAMCADRQMSILPCAARMLKPGGRLIYSTCTFSDEENEGVMERFLKACPDMELDRDAQAPWFSPGRLPGTFRLYPHRIKGEGHFVAALRKKGQADFEDETVSAAAAENAVKEAARQAERQGGGKDKKKRKQEAFSGRERRKGGQVWFNRDDRKMPSAYLDWEKETLMQPLEESFKSRTEGQGRYTLFGDMLYMLPEDCPSLEGLKVLRAGLQLGQAKGKVWKPSHSLAMALHPSEVLRIRDLNDEEISRYLNGEALGRAVCTKAADQEDSGWTLVVYRGISIGWGKTSSGVMKNHYPKGLRALRTAEE